MAAPLGRAGKAEVELGKVYTDDGVVAGLGEVGGQAAVGTDDTPKLVVGFDDPHRPEVPAVDDDLDSGRLHPGAAHSLQDDLGRQGAERHGELGPVYVARLLSGDDAKPGGIAAHRSSPWEGAGGGVNSVPSQATMARSPFFAIFRISSFSRT